MLRRQLVPPESSYFLFGPRGTGKSTFVRASYPDALVAQHLRAWIEYSGSDATLSYWRTRAGLEVDFVVYGKGVFDAVDVKHAADLRPADLRGLRAFGDEYPEARRVLLYRGEHALVRDGVHVLPCDTYLRALHRDRPLPPAAPAS